MNMDSKRPSKFTKSVNVLKEKLNDLDMDSSVDLPSVIVVGDQSSGKSSALQCIIKHDILPKGKETVTRGPIRINMHKSTGDNQYAKFPNFSSEVFSLDRVTEMIMKLTEKLTQVDYMTNEEIVVDLYSPDMIDLTVLDLPGLISYPDKTKNQPDNLKEIIEKMILARIQSENVLILAITPANNDLNNSGALGMAKKVDPEGKRTIGVFTKIDVDPRIDAVELIERINSQLQRGSVGIVCRSQEDINSGVSLDEQFTREENYFRTHTNYKNYPEWFGTESLRLKLETEFKVKFREKVPVILATISNKIEDLSNKLYEFGEPLPDGSKLISYTHTYIEQLFRNIDGLMDGSLVSIDLNEEFGGVMFRNVIQEFHTKMNSITELFDSDSDKLTKIYKNSCGLEGICSISSTLLKRIYEKNVIKLRTPINSLLEKSFATYEDFVNRIEYEDIKIYKKLKNLFIRTFMEVGTRLMNETKLKLDFLVDLESQCLDPDLISSGKIDSRVYMSDYILTVVKEFFIKAKNSLNENAPKYIKYYFIKQCFIETKKELHNIINDKTEKDLEELYSESKENCSKREAIVNKIQNLKRTKTNLLSLSESFYY